MRAVPAGDVALPKRRPSCAPTTLRRLTRRGDQELSGALSPDLLQEKGREDDGAHEDRHLCGA